MSKLVLPCCLTIYFATWMYCGQTLFVQGYTSEDVKNLTNYLFNDKMYNKKVRTHVNDSEPTNILVGLWLISIVNLQEKSQILKFSAQWFMEWYDPNLAWNSSDFNGITEFIYPQEDLWIPDITIVNSVETMDQLAYDKTDKTVLSVHETGKVTLTPQGVFSINCAIDITYYPFDTQQCQIIISTILSKAQQINLLAAAHWIWLQHYTPSGTWAVVDTKLETATDVLYRSQSQVLINIRLSRLRTFYVISLIVPLLLLAVTSTLVFALPPNSGEKMGTSITVLLAFTVYLGVISEQMPKSSHHVSVLSVYLTFLLGSTVLAVALSVLTVNLYFHNDDVDPLVRKITVKLRRWMGFKRERKVVTQEKASSMAYSVEGRSDPKADVSGKHQAQPAFIQLNHEPWSEGDNLKEVTWKTVSATLDGLFIRLFSFLIFSASVACMVVLGVCHVN